MTVNAVALPTIDAEINESNRVAETTNSSSSGRATWLGTVSEADFRCTVVFDSASLLSSGSINVGSSLTVRGDLGDSGKFYTGTAVIEKARHYWNNRQGVVEAEVTGKYSGSLTRPA